MSGPIFIKMSNYNSPKIVEVQGKEWINYGSDNNYFGYLLDRYRGSPTNNAIINGVSDQIVGDGLNQELVLFPSDNLSRWAFDLKCYGWYMQVIVLSDDLANIERIDYSPVQNWRAGKADISGKITEYFYSDDWKQINKKQFKPVAYPVYNSELDVYTSVLPVKPYRTGSFYYPTVDYQGGLQYAHIEEEISNFHINNIKNGFAPGMIVNFNNGDPGQESRDAITRDIKANLQGSSNSGSIIVAFNEDKDKAATISTVDISDLDKQYQFLSEESTKKIMVAHRVTSPFFFGIRDSAGFGSNADEIKNSWLLWERTVLNPFREIMIKNIEYIQDEINQPVTGLAFIPMTPIEFTDAVAPTGPQTMSAQAETNLIDWIEQAGETVDETEWELVDEGEVDYNLENEIELNLATRTGMAIPNAKSDQDFTIDGVNYKTRYQYTGNLSPEREFCVKMMSADKLYRKEDILRMGEMPVNPGHGPHGANTYSVFKYHGGVNCKHKWLRKTFASKSGIDTKSPNAPTISTNKAEKAGYRIRNPKEVATTTYDQPNHGSLPSNKKTWK